MALPLLGLLGVGLAALGTHAAIKPEWERMQRRRTGKEIDGLLADTDGPDEQARALVGAGLLSPAEFMQHGNTQFNRAADFNNSVALQELRDAGAMDRQMQMQGWEGDQADLQRAWDLKAQGNEFFATGNFDVGAFTQALIQKESGGDYGAIGPETKSGGKAYGKYQIMDSNIGPWSAKYLGQEISVQEFLANPELQDKIYQGRMMDMVEQHGPVDALSIWHSGVPLEQAIKEGRHDGTEEFAGTSTQDYVTSIWGSYLRSAGQNEARRQQEAAVSGAALEAQDEARPYADISNKADTVIAGLDDLSRVGEAFLTSPEGKAQIDQMHTSAMELFFDWKNDVYGEAEPNPEILKQLQETFRTPGNMLEDRERTRRFYKMMQMEAQKMAEYKSTRKLVEAGVLPRTALNGMNGGRLTDQQRNSVLLGQSGRPQGTVPVTQPIQPQNVPGSGISPHFRR